LAHVRSFTPDKPVADVGINIALPAIVKKELVGASCLHPEGRNNKQDSCWHDNRFDRTWSIKNRHFEEKSSRCDHPVPMGQTLTGDAASDYHPNGWVFAASRTLHQHG
jgi:hypothetical protein